MFQIFIPATTAAKDKETGEIVYVPGIFSVTEKTIIWCANGGYLNLTEAIQTAKELCYALEVDFVNSCKTGEKNSELYSIMNKEGVFFDSSNSESIIIDAPHIALN